jgi:hypothetical protein
MSKNEAAALREGPRSISVLIREMANGELEKKASEAVQKLMMAIEEEATSRGKAKGFVTLKIYFESDNKGNGTLSYAVEKKEPTKVNGGGPFWLTKGSNVTLEPPGRDPRIRDVSSRDDDDLEDEDGVAVEEEKPRKKTAQRSVRTV